MPDWGRFFRQTRRLYAGILTDSSPINAVLAEKGASRRRFDGFKTDSKQLTIIDAEIRAYETTFTTISEQLNDALNLIEDCGSLYRYANNYKKRLINQAIFSRLWVDNGGNVTAEFAKPFNSILEANYLATIETKKESAVPRYLQISSPSLQITYLNFFGNCLNNDFLSFVDKKDAGPKPLRRNGFLTFRASFSELLTAFLNCTINGESCKEKFKIAGCSELLKAKRGRQELAALHSWRPFSAHSFNRMICS